MNSDEIESYVRNARQIEDFIMIVLAAKPKSNKIELELSCNGEKIENVVSTLIHKEDYTTSDVKRLGGLLQKTIQRLWEA